MYVITVLDLQSDTPGIVATFGPFETWEQANGERDRASRLTLVADEQVQVARIEAIRDPL